MVYFYIYLSGCFLNGLSLLLHYLFGFFTSGQYFKSNYRKIGLYVSYMGSIEHSPPRWQLLVMDCILSYIALVINVFNLIIRACRLLFSRTPENFKQLLYRMKTFDLTGEQVFSLDLEVSSLARGTKYTEDIISQMVEELETLKNIKLDLPIILKLLKDKDLLE